MEEQSSMLYYFFINVSRRICSFRSCFPCLDKYPFEESIEEEETFSKLGFIRLELGEHCNHRTKDTNVYACTCQSFLWTRKIRFCDPPFVVWWGTRPRSSPEIAPPSMSLPSVGNARSNLYAVYFRNV